MMKTCVCCRNSCLRQRRRYVPPTQHHGLSAVEVIVAFTVLTTVISVAAPLVVRHGWILGSQRDYRLALDELSNQLDVLTTLPEQELAAALQSLAPSSLVAANLPSAVLKGELDEADLGSRLTLSLSWDGLGEQPTQITLVGWWLPDATAQVAQAQLEKAP